VTTHEPPIVSRSHWIVLARRARPALAALAWPLATVVILIGAWQLAVTVFRIPAFLLPTPWAVASLTVSEFDVLLRASLVTAWEILLAFVLSAVIGVPLGVLLVESRLFERAVYPLIVASQAFPKLAIAPVVVVWFGLGLATKVIIAFLIAFFPVVIGTAVGLREGAPEARTLARSIGLTRLSTFVKITLPAALPSVFGGLKVAVTLAVVGAVVTEFLGASDGLGHILIVASGTAQTDLLFSTLIALTVLGLVFYGAVAAAERLAIPWRREPDSRA
jgi:NitT/TauT family transport system permease protein